MNVIKTVKRNSKWVHEHKSITGIDVYEETALKITPYIVGTCVRNGKYKHGNNAYFHVHGCVSMNPINILSIYGNLY